MLKSIRWRLQLWYALVLLVVIGGFAGILLYEVRAARFREVDHGLDASIHYMDTSLRRLPPWELQGKPAPASDERRPPPPKPDDDPSRPPPQRDDDRFGPPPERDDDPSRPRRSRPCG